MDIGDKSWGVMACQRYFGGIEGGRSLHVGDQFLSAGANDFKVRCAMLLMSKAGLMRPAGSVSLHNGMDCESIGNGTIARRDSEARGEGNDACVIVCSLASRP